MQSTDSPLTQLVRRWPTPKQDDQLTAICPKFLHIFHDGENAHFKGATADAGTIYAGVIAEALLALNVNLTTADLSSLIISWVHYFPMTRMAQSLRTQRHSDQARYLPLPAVKEELIRFGVDFLACGDAREAGDKAIEKRISSAVKLLSNENPTSHAFVVLSGDSDFRSSFHVIQQAKFRLVCICGVDGSFVPQPRSVASRLPTGCHLPIWTRLIQQETATSATPDAPSVPSSLCAPQRTATKPRPPPKLMLRAYTNKLGRILTAPELALLQVAIEDVSGLVVVEMKQLGVTYATAAFDATLASSREFVDGIQQLLKVSSLPLPPSLRQICHVTMGEHPPRKQYKTRAGWQGADVSRAQHTAPADKDLSSAGLTPMSSTKAGSDLATVRLNVWLPEVTVAELQGVFQSLLRSLSNILKLHICHADVQEGAGQAMLQLLVQDGQEQVEKQLDWITEKLQGSIQIRGCDLVTHACIAQDGCIERRAVMRRIC